MTPCPDVLEALALEPEEGLGASIQAHLSACPACREVREDLGALRRLSLGPKIQVPPPAALPVRARPGFTRWIGAAAAAGFLLPLLLVPCREASPGPPKVDPEHLRCLLAPRPGLLDPILVYLPSPDPKVSISISYLPFAFPQEGGSP